MQSSTGPAPRISTYSVAPGTFTVLVSSSYVVPVTIASSA